jgi:hypothetical protein
MMGSIEKLQVVSSLDGSLLDSNISDIEKSSTLAMMGAIMYGSFKAMAPSRIENEIKARFSNFVIRVNRDENKIHMEISPAESEASSHLEKP